MWRVHYQERARDAETWANEHDIRPAADDRVRVCLVAVDIQNTFCTPGFELFVPGAVEDSRRLCEFVYRNLRTITEIVPTLDTHQAIQIFHSAFLVDSDGNRPGPYASSRPRTWRRGSGGSIPTPASIPITSSTTRGSSRRRPLPAHRVAGRHAMLGGIGHALVSAVEEAFFFHAIARRTAPAFEIKGFNPLTEHYSVLGPEVMGDKNEALIGRLLQSFDAVVFAGQAKSHCVAWTIDDLLSHPDAESRSWRGACTCSRTAPRRSSFPAWSTTRRKRTTPSGDLPRPG